MRDRLGPTVPIALGGVGLLAVVSHAFMQPRPVPLLVLHAMAWLLAVGLGAVVSQHLRVVTRAVRRARSAIDLLDDAVLVVDAATLRVVFANAAAGRFAGLDVVALIGRRIWDAGPWPELEDLVEVLDGRTLSTRIDDRHVEVVGERVDWEGERALVLVLRDVTEPQQAIARLADRENRFRVLAEETRGIVYRLRVEPALEVEYVSGAVSEVLGFSPGEVRGDPGLVVRRARPEHRGLLDLRGPDHVHGEAGVHVYGVQHAEGHWVQLEDHHRPEFDEDGRLVAIQGVVYDVTAEWETEQALDEAQRSRDVAAETLQRTARIERTFLQSVSHELRTPMTSALGFARMLLNRSDAMNPRQQDTLLRRLVENVERIDGLVGQLLDFDRYANDDLDLDRTLIRIDELVERAVAEVDMGGRRLETHVELVVALVDARRVQRLVEDLLRNAARHTPPTTTVRLALTLDGDLARIVVEDDGLGIGADLAAHLFDPFAQGAGSLDQPNPGVGLGLALARATARLHGGEVRHEPVLPHGARFVVELPVSVGARLPV